MFAISLMTGRSLTIDGDLFNMLPSSTLGKIMGMADEQITASVSQSVYILVSHEDFDIAKATADEVYDKLKDNKFFQKLSLYSGMDTLNEIEDFVHQYRWNLLDEDSVSMLSTEDGARNFADNALASAGGFYTYTSLKNLETDPFLLDEKATQNYVAAIQNAGASMTMKDGVLASEKDGRWYIFMNGILTKEGVAIASSDNGVTSIYSVCEPLEKDGVRFVYSGVPFNSHKSSNNAVTEMSIISVISLAFIVILLLAVFRAPAPIIASLLSIVISMVTGFSATHFIFGKVHILSMLLGTSLIGSCIDYSLHFFMNWKGNVLLNSGAEIRKHIRKGLVLSLLSTIICYVMLLFTPFNLLKQLGVFSSVGIFSSFLTVTGLYPLLKIPPEKKRTIPLLKLYHSSPLKKSHLTRSIATVAIFIVLVVILIVNHEKAAIHNDMYRLSNQTGRILDDYNLACEVTNYNPAGWFIVSGDTQEEVLKNEEYVC
ncbi:MAG: MMPL family transporter, partial [Treponema sp.]|nr:MMPL family transporter [Treponema sp.]